MMKKQSHAVKFTLSNYECGMCETGVVQIHNSISRGTLTTKISGCLDCGHAYGIRQAMGLTPYTRKDFTWG